MFEKLSSLSAVELLAFIATAGIILGLLVLLPFKIMQSIKKK